MSDFADDAQGEIDNAIAMQITLQGGDYEVGYPGECNECELPSARLIGGECAPCRDRLAKLRVICGRRE